MNNRRYALRFIAMPMIFMSINIAKAQDVSQSVQELARTQSTLGAIINVCANIMPINKALIDANYEVLDNAGTRKIGEEKYNELFLSEVRRMVQITRTVTPKVWCNIARDNARKSGLKLFR